MSVYNDIIHKIKSGRLTPGDKLPPEPELARQYGVSRVTVGRALKMLEDINLIYRIKKSGTFINGKKSASTAQRIVPIILPFEESLNFGIIEGAQNYALMHNCFTPFFNTNNIAKREQEILLNILNMNVDGLICYPCSLFANMDLFAQCRTKGLPLVFLDRMTEGVKAPLITCNNEKGMFDVVESLIADGHREIGYFMVDEHMFISERERFRGYMEALIRHNIPIRREFIFRTQERIHESELTPNKRSENFYKYTQSVGQELLQMDKKPTAICCVNDVSAISLQQMFYRMDDPQLKAITVTGFDNLRQNGSFTTVQQDFHELGRTAVMTVLHMIDGIAVPDICYTGVQLIGKKNT